MLSSCLNTFKVNEQGVYVPKTKIFDDWNMYRAETRDSNTLVTGTLGDYSNPSFGYVDLNDDQSAQLYLLKEKEFVPIDLSVVLKSLVHMRGYESVFGENIIPNSKNTLEFINDVPQIKDYVVNAASLFNGLISFGDIAVKEEGSLKTDFREPDRQEKLFAFTLALYKPADNN